MDAFYIFYDKYQLIQGAEIPEYIRETDCKLTLYTNCRNTENIAQTATAPLTKLKNKKVLRNNIDGEKSTFYISSDLQTSRAEYFLWLCRDAHPKKNRWLVPTPALFVARAKDRCRLKPLAAPRTASTPQQ